MAENHPMPSEAPHHYSEIRVSEAGATTRRSNAVAHQTIDDRITTRRATADEIAFRNGYVQGREQERRIQEHAQRRMQHHYAHQGMVGGLLTGILLTLTVGFIATMLAVFSPQWKTNVPPTVQSTESVR